MSRITPAVAPFPPTPSPIYILMRPLKCGVSCQRNKKKARKDRRGTGRGTGQPCGRARAVRGKKGHTGVLWMNQPSAEVFRCSPLENVPVFFFSISFQRRTPNSRSDFIPTQTNLAGCTRAGGPENRPIFEWLMDFFSPVYILTRVVAGRREWVRGAARSFRVDCDPICDAILFTLCKSCRHCAPPRECAASEFAELSVFFPLCIVYRVMNWWRSFIRSCLLGKCLHRKNWKFVYICFSSKFRGSVFRWKCSEPRIK